MIRYIIKILAKFSSEQRKEIPIYYIPIHPKDRDRRDSYGWSVLYGAYSAWRVHTIYQNGSHQINIMYHFRCRYTISVPSALAEN
jgi:hypothetical protein